MDRLAERVAERLRTKGGQLRYSKCAEMSEGDLIELCRRTLNLNIKFRDTLKWIEGRVEEPPSVVRHI